jgi:hypothetical protein
MIRLVSLLSVLFLLVGCESTEHRSPVPTVPTPSQAANPPPFIPDLTVRQQLTLGQELTDTFIGNPLIYGLTVRSDGTLVIRLHWDAMQGDPVEVAHLLLIIGECAVPHGRGYPTCPNARDF